MHTVQVVRQEKCYQMGLWDIESKVPAIASVVAMHAPAAMLLSHSTTIADAELSADEKFLLVNGELQLYKDRCERLEQEKYQDLCKYKELLYMKDQKIQEMHELAFIDPLTGLYNANFLDRKLRKALRAKAQTGKQSRYIAITVIDVNNLKAMNDTWGHYQGNQLIKHYAEKLLEFRTFRDIVIRVGGDEFIVISLGRKLSKLRRHAQLLREKLSFQKLVIFGNKELAVSASAGSSYAILDKHFSFNAVFIRADRKMYTAKKGKIKPPWLRKAGH